MNKDKYRIINTWTHAETGERVYHYADYPDIMDCFDLTPRGSEPGYCWGDYHITESGELIGADCHIKADEHIITACYTLYVYAPARLWYIRATGSIGGSSLPRNYWLGSTPPFCHKVTKVPPTLIFPSKVRKLLAPLMKSDGPARLAAEYVLADMDTWDSTLIYELENRRHNGSFWGLKHVMT